MCVHTAESPWMIMENAAKDNRLLKIGKEHLRLISSFDKVSLQQHSISETNQRIFRGLVALAGATVIVVVGRHIESDPESRGRDSIAYYSRLISFRLNILL